MIVRKFICEEDRDYGGKGFRPLWIRDANALDGMACAHDVLEHAVNEPGPAEGEFMAMGAAVYLRGMTGWFYEQYPMNIHTSEGHIGATVAQVMEKVRWGEQSLAAPPRTRPMREPDVEAFMREAMHCGRKDFNAERGYRSEDWGALTAEEEARIMGWMRLGYRRTAPKWAHVGDQAAAYLFTRLGRAIGEELKRADLGMELEVRVNPRDASFRAWCDYPQDN